MMAVLLRFHSRIPLVVVIIVVAVTSATLLSRTSDTSCTDCKKKARERKKDKSAFVQDPHDGKLSVETTSVPQCHSIREPRAFFPDFHHGSVIVGCHQVHFRVNRVMAFTRRFIRFDANPPGVVFGILSDSDPAGYAKRQAIRATWGKYLFNRYFVIPTGPTDDQIINKEFYQYNDVIWLDLPADSESDSGNSSFSKATIRMERIWVTLAVLHKRVHAHTHLMIIDDETYVNVEQLHAALNEGGEAQPVDYWGVCGPNYNRSGSSSIGRIDAKMPNDNILTDGSTAPTCSLSDPEIPFVLKEESLACLAKRRVFEHTTTDILVVDALLQHCGEERNLTTALPDATNKWLRKGSTETETNVTGKILQYPVSNMEATHKSNLEYVEPEQIAWLP